MEWIEITAKSIPAAVDAALDELGVDENDLEYEVLEEPRRGLLGRLAGAPTARIRARVKPISREKPDRRRRRGPREGGREGGRPERGENGGPSRSRSGGRAPRSETESSGRAAAGEGQGRTSEREPVRARAGGGDDEDTGPARAGQAPRRRNRSRGRGGGGGASGGGGGRRTSEDAGATSMTEDAEESDVTAPLASLDEQTELATTLTRGLVEQFDLEAEVSGRAEGDDDVKVDVAGKDLGLLIGPKATTLDAIQELVRTMVQRRIGGHGARIHVDVSGYRARRQAALAEFSRQAAQRALESGRDQVFEPMSPADRKIVHDTVNAIDGVETVSEGEEPRRRVVIKAS